MLLDTATDYKMDFVEIAYNPDYLHEKFQYRL